MKKIGKISINPEKVIKNEDLANLRGGYEGGSIKCYCKDEEGYTHYEGTIDDCDKAERWIENMCWEIHQPHSYCEGCGGIIAGGGD